MIWPSLLRWWGLGCYIYIPWNNVFSLCSNRVRSPLLSSLSGAWNLKPSSLSFEHLSIVIAIEVFWNLFLNDFHVLIWMSFEQACNWGFMICIFELCKAASFKFHLIEVANLFIYFFVLYSEPPRFWPSS
jgi:hypothetical protein